MISTTAIDTKTIWNYLSEVLDPEVPVINVVELGIVREVAVDGESVLITITPTYTGCPAMHAIEFDIIAKLKEKGLSNAKIKTVYSPAWTTDWLTDEAREKLRIYGIAPPDKRTNDRIESLLHPEERVIHCPHCNSVDTILKSQFGSTACKALYFCNKCQEPFDYFKCI
jgi:ring-1,2-phenylacetyl-CoA epoxidase subunit PaaD